MGFQEVQDRQRHARAHLEFVAQLRRSQLERGARFLCEHPATASSWSEPAIVELLATPGRRGWWATCAGSACAYHVR
eukprot:14009503-Alexandrium_andersonii.AAC.1